MSNPDFNNLEEYMRIKVSTIAELSARTSFYKNCKVNQTY